MRLLHQELTGQLIGGAIEVHSKLGPGFLESVYAESLCVELNLRGIPFQREPSTEVLYKDVRVGIFRPDFLIDGKVIIELKAVSRIREVHIAQVLNYLNATRLRLGFLFNFGEDRFRFKRLIK